ncbi:hypothetical protein CK486_09900 [Pseudomonas sp. HAR-UPW-AIA-41]|uniref:fused response regulator/phosphatase n=1 Tax=Pseudomonas sp. HAR-UPW-AIA-41 TaxID=1985301 RepID=UPI000BB2FF0C|nr:fused response regulator/phosphatase [Pseudomonas sp. HAR-UPW-AIA-41]PAV48020.1 hypothetical protein CK486_09900 [Pseudomonas sp. HAR-UPW-AIA-41]
MRALCILIIDDQPAIGRLLSSYLSKVGHQCQYAPSGDEALKLYAQQPFDLVLVDQSMPGLDGQQTTRLLRELQLNMGWRPILMLSGNAETEAQIAALEAGCDDFVAKPVSLDMLAAKINSFQRIAEMQEQITRQNRELIEYRERDKEERNISAYLMSRLARTAKLEGRQLDYFLKPVSEVSGDLLLAWRASNGDRYALLADATGHDLPAALSLLPVSETFYNMAAKGFSLEGIARKLNRKSAEYLPANRFVALLMALYSPLDGTLQIWNGGIPGALLMADDGRVLERFESLNFPIGILDEDDPLFCCQVETVHITESCQFSMFSDGLIEAESISGMQFGLDRVEAVLHDVKPEQRAARLQEALALHTSGAQPHDDVAYMHIYCEPAKLDMQPAPPAFHECKPWSLQLQLNVEQLRNHDLEPLISSFCQSLGLEPAQHGIFSLVLRELLANAIEHGLLRLDTSIKHLSDGFERYLQLRQSSLQALEHGELQVDIQQASLEGIKRLSVTVTDSGPGFDFQNYKATASEEQFHGRGLYLLRQLCADLQFGGVGNQVTATLQWQ